MLWNYLKDRLGYLLVWVMFVGIFSVFCFLYGLPLDGIIYAIVLCLLLCLVFGCVDFASYCKKANALRHIAKALPQFEVLPIAQGLHEQQYQFMLRQLCDEYTNTVTQNRVTYQQMEDFYGLWAHQIKTPIAALHLLLQADNGEDNKQLRAELFKIERYTDLVLNYLRLEDISTDLSFENYPLDNIVRQAVKKFAPVFIAKGIRIQMDTLQVSVLTDEKWLVFALEQIISNALKYTDRGGVVTIRSNSNILVVQDNGMGISAEDLPRIFEKGFTGYNGRMDKKATGIGLYLTQKTLQRLGHTIQIVSDGVHGTTVTIDLSRKHIEHE